MTNDEKREILTRELKAAGVPDADLPAAVAEHLPATGWTVPGKGEVSSPRLRDPEGELVPVAEALAARAAAAEAAKPKPPTATERTATYMAGRRAERTVGVPLPDQTRRDSDLSTQEYLARRRARRTGS